MTFADARPLLPLVLSLAIAASHLEAQSMANSPAPVQPSVACLNLMKAAGEHARAHGTSAAPVLSPIDSSVLSGEVPVVALRSAGFRIVPWTTNDAESMHRILRLGVDGLITDRPDILQSVLAEERANPDNSAEQKARLASFDVTAHRGGRGLRPENTLPSFESGMDQLVTTLETDTGVSTDHVSLIWHDQFYNPQSCRRVDGKPYTMENRVYLQDISSTDAQKTFICDKIHFGADQKNDLSLSPVAVAFARQEHLLSPYVPTYAGQLFRFVRFYAQWYRSGPGKSSLHAAERFANAEKVRFNLETKILPDRLPAEVAGQQDTKVPADLYKNHTVGPQVFVDTLCGAILKEGMEGRAEVQSFDFRTLRLVEEQHPKIPTYYLTNNSRMLSSEFTPEPLRQPKP